MAKHSVWLDNKAHVWVRTCTSVGDVMLELKRQLAQESTALRRIGDLGGHDHLLSRLDVASKFLDFHVYHLSNLVN